ncbi:OLC1v1028416C1 [Oldenlandia corymbosa var. corymbosa]|uniref:non-specific serine/threonine protein kinase n=1 Tax=Oldenlandia corymbosa var. corymbosa TaxID=529605 RepID=A0AAV1CBM8_OLDCO|nr:OLC1v1028416C1 [Oldenlandia corymbosa var. corymbosa]
MLILFLIIYLYASLSSASVDVLFNSFTSNQLIFTGDATIDSSTIKLTKNVNNFSLGRAFYPYPIIGSNNSTIPSFSTSFVFSILPQRKTTPEFGLAFVISTSAIPPGDLLAGQYFGILSTKHSVAPILVVEFDTGQNPELDDNNDNHVGIDLNSPISVVKHEAGFYDGDEFKPVKLSSGKNIQAWIEFDGKELGINVTIAPVGTSKPLKPLLSYYDGVIAKYVSPSMLVGFSAGKTIWNETQRILAWSLADKGAPRQINTSDLPIILPESSPSSSSSSSISSGLIVGIAIICVAALLFISLSGLYWFKLRKKRGDKSDEVEGWEIDYWPHRFSYEELARATNQFSDDEILGRGGSGKVFKGLIQANNIFIAVKSINRDSKQGLREFMSEISTIGRLQHKNVVPLRGWCKEGQEMLLVYDYMPNGSLYSWIFSNSKTLSWHRRLMILTDIAEGLNYLHHGWLQLVLHRDIKSSNILLDSDLCAKLGDFGLAKLYIHGQAPTPTRLVGTIGYMAPELVKAGPTMGSDIFSFGVVVLEVVCGRKPTEMHSEYALALVDWVRKLHRDGRLSEAPDLRIAREEYEVADMERVLELGLACCDDVPELRPDMKEVVTLLMNLKTKYTSELQGVDCSDFGDFSTISNLSVTSDYGPRT